MREYTYTQQQMEYSQKRIAAGVAMLGIGGTVTHTFTYKDEDGNPRTSKFSVTNPKSVNPFYVVRIYKSVITCSCSSSNWRRPEKVLVPCKHAGAVLAEFPSMNPMHQYLAYEKVEVVA